MKKIISFLLLCFCCLSTNAQEKTDSKLFIELEQADSIIFEQGFNKCNMAALKEAVHPKLVFLHDQGGIQNYDEFFKAVSQNICSNPDSKPIRKLKAGSLSVYPLYNNGNLYGAIQMGEHDFYIQEPNKPLRHTSSAKFTHTWLLENGKWKLFQVLSYDHHSKD